MRGRFVKALAAGGLLAMMVVAGVGAAPAATPSAGGTPSTGTSTVKCSPTTDSSGKTTISCQGGGSGTVQCTTATTSDGTAVRCFGSAAALRAGNGGGRASGSVVVMPANGGTPPPGAKQITCPTRATSSGATPAASTGSTTARACYYIGSGTPPTTLPAPPNLSRTPGTPPAGATQVPCSSLPNPPAAGTAVLRSETSTNGSTPVTKCYVVKYPGSSSTP